MRRTVVMAVVVALAAAACGGGGGAKPTVTPPSVPTTTHSDPIEDTLRSHFLPVTYVLEDVAHVTTSLRRIDIPDDDAHVQMVVEGYALSDTAWYGVYDVSLLDQPAGKPAARWKADRDAEFNLEPGKRQEFALLIKVPKDAHFSLLEFKPRKEGEQTKGYVLDLTATDIPYTSSFAITAPPQ